MSEKMATILLVVVTLLSVAGCMSPNPMTGGQISHVGTSPV
jgi:hypothetical protein